MRYSMILAVSILFFFPAAANSQTTWYVDGTNTSGPWLGTQADPFQCIEDGTYAASNGDTVLVLPFTYSVGILGIDLFGKAITVTSEQGPDVTIIRPYWPTGGGMGFYCHSGEGSDTVLDGFTIIAMWGNAHSGVCNTNNSSPTVTNCIFTGEWSRAGMYNESSSPTVTNCIFSENSAYYYDGGGMYNESSSPTVTNCIFSENSAERYGGGMANLGDSHPTVNNCIFSENSAEQFGGGICSEYAPTSLTVTNCTFSGNSAEQIGGGMYVVANSTVINNCTFSGNSAMEGGGMLIAGFLNATVTNCTFYGNSAGWGGGGVSLYGFPTVINCTFSGNSAGCGGGVVCYYDSSPTVNNSVLWNNDAPEGPEIWIGDSSGPSTFTISYSDVKGGKASCHVEPNCTLNWVTVR